MTADPTRSPGAVEQRLVGLAGSLRRHGVGVGSSDVVDAGRVVGVLGLDRRDQLREGLACALLRRGGQREVFDDLFDLWFPAALADRDAVGARSPVADDPRTRREAAAALRDALATALAAADERALDALAARVLAELGQVPGDGGGDGWSASRALDLLSPQVAIAAALARIRDAADGIPGGSGDGSSGSGASGHGSAGPAGGRHYADRFTRDEVRAAVAAFRRRVEREARRRNAEIRGVERISRYAVRPPVENTPFVLAGKLEVDELRQVIAPLAKKLATRLAARQRRAARGEIDLRKTLRASMSTGGVPMRPVLRRRHPHRPELVLICDMSSSVAGFSRFTILLMQALAGQFRRVRIFGFVNVVDELTQLVLAAPAGADLSSAFDDTAAMTRWHRNSDYGSALLDFHERYAEVVTHRSTVLILGDARTNHTHPQRWVLEDLVARARHVSWLNPELPSQWGSGDSVALHYAEVVDMHECATAAQLRQFVSRTLVI